jgi:hypothetical protein
MELQNRGRAMNNQPPAPRDSMIYTGESVCAILADSKWQSRRVMEPQPQLKPVNLGNGRPEDVWLWDPGAWSKSIHPVGNPDTLKLCPYGTPGHRLWVKEAIYYNLEHDNFYYAADNRGVGQLKFNQLIEQFGRDAFLKRQKRTARYMPNICRRIQLLVKRIRIQRVQETSAADIRAEGLSCPEHDFDSGFCTSECPTLRAQWVKGWNAINAARGYSYEINPWVWAIDFERMTVVPV